MYRKAVLYSFLVYDHSLVCTASIVQNITPLLAHEISIKDELKRWLSGVTF